MNAKDAIRGAADLSTLVLTSYVRDLEDADLLRRPEPGCNHLAWQLGHVIASEVQLLQSISPENGMALPEGFADAHSKEQCNNDEAASFLDKATYVSLFEKVRQASQAALDAYPGSALDDAAPEAFREFCPTMGHMWMLVATHPMMHAGQFVIVRRQLGKPIVI
jgi:hypothetical protein